MRTTFLLSFAATALATIAFAQGNAAPTATSQAAIEAARADTNRDGRVSRAEAQAITAAHFDAADTDRDGTLSASEARGPGRRLLRQAGGALTRADALARADTVFTRMDANGDGQLAQGEIAAGVGRIRAAIDRGVPVDRIAPVPGR